MTTATTSSHTVDVVYSGGGVEEPLVSGGNEHSTHAALGLQFVGSGSVPNGAALQFGGGQEDDGSTEDASAIVSDGDDARSGNANRSVVENRAVLEVEGGTVVTNHTLETGFVIPAPGTVEIVGGYTESEFAVADDTPAVIASGAAQGTTTDMAVDSGGQEINATGTIVNNDVPHVPSHTQTIGTMIESGGEQISAASETTS